MNAIFEQEGTEKTEGEMPASDWKARVREVELGCARTWLEGAKYWRGVAARAVIDGDSMRATLALVCADEREMWANEILSRHAVEDAKKN